MEYNRLRSNYKVLHYTVGVLS